MHTHKVKVRPVNIQHTLMLRSTHTSTYSAHTPSQYSLALATDGWQFMLYSMNTEFSEKVLRAMKKHWLTKQHTEQKRGWGGGGKEILNFKFKLKRSCKSKPNPGTWLVVYYASAQCAKLLSVGQWGFIACRRRKTAEKGMWLKGCSQEYELKWPAQGKECHLLTESGSASFVSQQKGCCPISVQAVQYFHSLLLCLCGTASFRFESGSQFIFSHSCWTRRESIITFMYTFFL